MCVHSVGGAIYTILFDDFTATRKKLYFLVDQKATTVLKVLKLYKAVVEAITGMQLVFFQTDNTPEFWSDLIQTWFKSKGTIHIPGPLYSSAQWYH